MADLDDLIRHAVMLTPGVQDQEYSGCSLALHMDDLPVAIQCSERSKQCESKCYIVPAIQQLLELHGADAPSPRAPLSVWLAVMIRVYARLQHGRFACRYIAQLVPQQSKPSVPGL
jgi:hypothetical protein